MAWFFLFSPAGIAVLGLDQALTVGQSATLSCVTYFITTVSTIEWGDQSSAVLKIANQTVLNYTIPLVSDNLQGMLYTCSVVAKDGKAYKQTVEIQVISELSFYFSDKTLQVTSPCLLPQFPVGL